MPKFGQRILESAMRAAMKVGIAIGRIEIRTDGTLVIFAIGEEPDSPDALDAELAEFRRSNGTH